MYLIFPIIYTTSLYITVLQLKGKEKQNPLTQNNNTDAEKGRGFSTIS